MITQFQDMGLALREITYHTMSKLRDFTTVTNTLSTIARTFHRNSHSFFSRELPISEEACVETEV